MSRPTFLPPMLATLVEAVPPGADWLFERKLDGDAPGVTTTHWVEPELVAEVGFTEWTSHGRLRHPRNLGLRDDKDAADVVRERAVAVREGHDDG